MGRGVAFEQLTCLHEQSPYDVRSMIFERLRRGRLASGSSMERSEEALVSGLGGRRNALFENGVHDGLRNYLSMVYKHLQVRQILGPGLD